LVKTAGPELSEGRTIELARMIDRIVDRHATFADWTERGDILRDIRLELIRTLAHSEDTKPLIKPETGLIDEALTAATARHAIVD
jgi:hypothetical protein